eukprot:g2231.t1
MERVALGGLVALLCAVAVSSFTASQLCLQYDSERDRCIKTAFSVFSTEFSYVEASKYMTCGLVRTHGGMGQEKDVAHGIGDGMRCYGDQEVQPPVQDAGRAFVKFSIGHHHICAVDSVNLLVCWGDGEAAKVPHEIRLREIKQVSCGDSHTCVLFKRDSTVFCFGENAVDVPQSSEYRDVQVDADALSPSGEGYKVLTPFVHTYDFLASASLDTCGLMANGKVECWGGRAGLKLPSPPEDKRFEQIDMSAFYGCGLLIGGKELYCWGLFSLDIPTPASLGVEKFLSVATGERHVCLLLADNDHDVESLHGSASTVHCFGDNTFSQADVPKGEKFVAISAGSTHTCGLKYDWRMFCWGRRQPVEGMLDAFTVQARRQNVYD